MYEILCEASVSDVLWNPPSFDRSYPRSNPGSRTPSPRLTHSAPHSSKLTNNNLPIQPRIPRARPDHNTNFPLRHNPRLPADIPITQIPPPELKLGHLALPDAQLQLGEPPELAHRRVGRWQRHVELRNLGAGDGAAVGDGRRDGRHRVPERGGATGDGGARGGAGGDGGRRDGELLVGEVCVC